MASKKTQKMTGTEKKARDTLARDIRKGEETRAKGVKKSASFMHGGMRNAAIEKDLKKTMGAFEDYRHSDKYKSLSEFERGGKGYKGDEDFKRLKDFGVGGKAYRDVEDFKGLKPFEYGGKSYQDPNFYKEGLQGYQMAQRVLDPIQQDALRNYSLSTIPGVVNQYGSEGKSSSALTQALAASKQNLASQLHAQTVGLAAQYGGDISRMNLGERARQQELQQQTALQRSGMNIGQLSDIRGLQQSTEMGRAQMNIGQQSQNKALQYGAASDIFQGKRAASFGLGEQQRSNIEYLNNLAMQASFNAQNAGLGGMGGAFVPNSISGGGSGGMSPIAGGAMGALGGAAAGAKIGTALGGPGWGTAIGGGLGAIGGIFASK